MTMQAVCLAWATQLQANVTGLDTTTIPATNLHLYSPVSVEKMAANAGERHLAVWPEGDPDVVDALLAGGAGGSDLITQSFIVSAWEPDGNESSRLQDDETAWDTWETLFQAIRARFYVAANMQLGSVDTTRYAGGAMDRQGGIRLLSIRFRVQFILSMA